MKRFLILVVISTLLFNSQALATNKKPTVKPLKLIATVSNVDEFAGLVASGTTIVVYGNKGDRSFAKGIDLTGKELWNIALDSASPSVATAATVDSAGTIWIAGSTSLQRATPTPSPSATPLNPDNITAIPDIFTTDLDAFTLWSLNPNTQALSQYSLQLASPILINALAVSKSGLTAVGSSGSVINSDLLGKIAKPIFIGSGATNLEAVIKASDGSMTVVGSSSETLSGKKLAGKVDGVILKLSKIGKVISVVRSSAPKASRSWDSASTALLLGGEVITGNRIESAITKFSNSFAPIWTLRLNSMGKTFISGSTYAFLQSSGPLSQFANWSPISPQALLLTFDAKGAITGGFSAPAEQSEVLGLSSSKELGILCISASADTVSIFTLN